MDKYTKLSDDTPKNLTLRNKVCINQINLIENMKKSKETAITKKLFLSKMVCDSLKKSIFRSSQNVWIAYHDDIKSGYDYKEKILYLNKDFYNKDISVESNIKFFNLEEFIKDYPLIIKALNELKFKRSLN